MSDIINVKEAALYFGIHELTVYKHAKARKIPGFKVGGQWRFKKSVIDTWIENKIAKGMK